LWSVLKTERNARIHAGLAAAVVGMGLWLQVDFTGWSLLALTIGFVMCAEVVNTAIEAIVDLVSPNYHDTARLAKDLAAGAVLFAAITAVCVGLLVLGPPLWQRMFQ
jgi:diacylglycerol kinase